MSKLIKLLTELRDEYVNKKKCYIGNLSQNIDEHKKELIRIKIYKISDKINDIEKTINDEILKGIKDE